jgi:gamma-glutamyltranspeptidase/glutathione hydrolase
MVWAINYALNTEPPSGPSNLSFFQNPTWKPDFAPNGTIVRYKEMMTRKRYADTLRNISRGGPDSFYKGYIADTMIKAVKEAKGIMTQNDLDEYSIKFRDISRVNYRGYTLTSSTTPSSGAVTLNVLGILNHYHDFFANQSMVNISTHRMVEAIKFGYAYVCSPLPWVLPSSPLSSFSTLSFLSQR